MLSPCRYYWDTEWHLRIHRQAALHTFGNSPFMQRGLVEARAHVVQGVQGLSRGQWQWWRRWWGCHGGVPSAGAGSKRRAARAGWCVGRWGQGRTAAPFPLPHVARCRNPRCWNRSCWPGRMKHSGGWSKNLPAKAQVLAALAHR